MIVREMDLLSRFGRNVARLGLNKRLSRGGLGIIFEFWPACLYGKACVQPISLIGVFFQSKRSGEG
jgi:hypothetical protein